MQIYLVRHGLAGSREKWNDSDELRPLTGKGKKKMKKTASSMRKLGIKLTHIYTSPLVRATQTAAILHKQFKKAAIKETEHMLPSGDPGKVMDLLSQHDDRHAVALVGHEPHMGKLASFMLSGREASYLTFKKGGVAYFETHHPIEPSGIVLKWLLEPNHMIAMKG